MEVQCAILQSTYWILHVNSGGGSGRKRLQSRLEELEVPGERVCVCWGGGGTLKPAVHPRECSDKQGSPFLGLPRPPGAQVYAHRVVHLQLQDTEAALQPR